MCRQSATVCLVKSPTRQHRVTGGLAERLATLADPRCRRGKRHPFVAVLLIACSAVVSGARSGLLPRVTQDPPGDYGAADKRLQAYCYRMCLTDVPENRLPWPKPANYDEGFVGEVLLRTALVNSMNIPAVKTFIAVGLKNMAA